MKRISNVALVLLLLLGVTGLAFAGGGGEAASTGPVTIKMDAGAGGFNPGTPNAKTGKPIAMLQTLADEYKKLHPNVTIQFVDVGNREGLVAQMAGETAGDIENAFYMQWEDIGKGWWLSMDDALGKPNPYVKGNKKWIDIFQPMQKAMKQADGKIYAISIMQAMSGLYYNKDIFQKVGISGAPKNWAEFIADQQKLKSAGYVPFLLFSEHALAWGEAFLVTELYDDIIGEIDLDKDGFIDTKENVRATLKGYWAPDNPRYRQVWQLMKDWSQYWLPQPVSAWAPEQLYKTFNDQKGAMLLDIQRFAGTLATDPNVTFKFGIFPFPKVTKATSQYANTKPAPTLYYAVPQWGVTMMAQKRNNLAQVVDWLQFITAPQNSGRVLNETGDWVPNITGADLPAYLKDYEGIMKQSRPYFGLVSQLLGTEYGDKYIRLATDYLYGNKLSLDDFMKQLGADMLVGANQLAKDNNWTF